MKIKSSTIQASAFIGVLVLFALNTSGPEVTAFNWLMSFLFVYVAVASMYGMIALEEYEEIEARQFDRIRQHFADKIRVVEQVRALRARLDELELLNMSQVESWMSVELEELEAVTLGKKRIHVDINGATEEVIQETAAEAAAAELEWTQQLRR